MTAQGMTDDEFHAIEQRARRRGAVRIGVTGVLAGLIGLGFFWYYRDYSPQVTTVFEGRRFLVTSGFDPRILAVAFLAIGGLLFVVAVVMFLRSAALVRGATT